MSLSFVCERTTRARIYRKGIARADGAQRSQVVDFNVFAKHCESQPHMRDWNDLRFLELITGSGIAPNVRLGKICDDGTYIDGEVDTNGLKISRG